jgi:hypothetical protein
VLLVWVSLVVLVSLIAITFVITMGLVRVYVAIMITTMTLGDRIGSLGRRQPHRAGPGGLPAPQHIEGADQSVRASSPPWR